MRLLRHLDAPKSEAIDNARKGVQVIIGLTPKFLYV